MLNANNKRVSLANKNSSVSQKLARKKLNAEEKGYADIIHEKKDDGYVPGGFSLVLC